PATAFNRTAHGGRFAAVFPSHDPAVFTRVDIGATVASHFASNINFNSEPSAPPAPQTLDRSNSSAELTVGYGLPGKPDYDYARPFDYFNFELLLDDSSGVAAIFSRGLLYGTDYALGANQRGIWGVYGIYDYVAPNVFRVSNTAGALGITSQAWLGQN